MANEETIGRATIELGADGSKLAPEMAAATAKAQAELEKANRKMERAQASAMKAIQGHLDRINATKPTHEMRMLEQAVLKLGGSANLSSGQLARVTLEVNRLAAAGAKVPASLSGLTGIGSKLGAVFQALGTGGGISGALAAIGPAGLAASAGLGAVTLAGGAAVRIVSDLAAEGEKWANLAKSTGLGVVEVQQLSTLLEGAGVPAEALGTAMKELQKEIAGGGKELAKFGIEVEDLKDLSPEQQLREMAERIAAIEDPATRTAAAIAAFGRSGQELIPVLGGIAQGADKAFDALSGDQIAALERADDVLDDVSRKWEFLWKTAIAGAVQFAQTPAGRFLLGLATGGFSEGVIGIMSGSGGAGAGAKGRSGAGDDAFWQEQERQRRVEMAAAAELAKEKKKAAAAEAREEAAAAAKAKAAREKEKSEREQLAKTLLGAEKKTHEVALKFWAEQERLAEKATERLIADAVLREGIDRKQVNALGEMVEIVSQEALDAARRRASKAMGGSGQLVSDIPDEGLPTGFFTRFDDVADELGIEVNKVTAHIGKAAEGSATWSDRLDSLAQQLQTLAATTGGLTGKILNFAASLSSGLGGVLSGIQGFKDVKGGGFLGFLGKASSALGIVGSAIGVVGSLVGGIKKLFGGKSKEEKAAEASAKKQREEEARATQIKIAEEKAAALQNARTFAEALQERLGGGKLSEGLSKAIGGIVDRISGALQAAGLGSLDTRLKQSERFTEGQAIAKEIAGALAESGKAGIFDAGMATAGGEAASELLIEETAAAKEAGLDGTAATKAGFSAIAPILREQLNAAIRTGQQLDANTKRLIEEARNNGIEILADPLVEQIGIQREQLSVLRQIAGMPIGGGAGDGTGTGTGAGDGGAGGGAAGPDIFVEMPDRIERFNRIPEFATGGLIRAPESGGVLTARFHGDEIVAPADAFRMASPVAPAMLGAASGSLRDAGAGRAGISIVSSPTVNIQVAGSVDERTLAMLDARMKANLRNRDAELDALVARSAGRGL